MVKHNGQWGTVCDDGISPGVYVDRSVRAAHSACHTLGLSGGVIAPYKSGRKGPEGPIFMYWPDCATKTTNFLTCSVRKWVNKVCRHHEDVVLTCT